MLRCSSLLKKGISCQDTVRLYAQSIRMYRKPPYKYPTMNDLPIPSGSWAQDYARKNAKYNTVLLIGIGMFGVSVAMASKFIDWGTGPDWKSGTVTFESPKSSLEKESKDDNSEEVEILELETSTVMEIEQPVVPETEAETETEVKPKTPPPPPESSPVIPATPSPPVELSKKIEGSPEETIEASATPTRPIPEHVPYLIIGAGTTSVAAFRAIKSRDAKAKILVISGEGENPYMRPPLSKELWFNDDPALSRNLRFKQWNGKERSIFFEHDEYYIPVEKLQSSENGGIAILKNRTAVKIDATKRLVYLNDGTEITYDKCLLATGGQPKALPVFNTEDINDRVILFRSISDFKRLYEIVESGKNIAIIGGGFLGSELACALGYKSKVSKSSVVQVFPEQGNMGKVLPEYLSLWTMNKVKAEGVEVVNNSYVKNAKIGQDGKVKLLLNTDKEISTDHVVVAVGLTPNVDLANSSGLEVDDVYGGFRVNAELEARSNLWVAGDAASFFDIKLGRRRVEHHDHAIVSGRLAGENMTGAGKPYWHQSMFWSDLGPEVGYEAIGIVDSTLPTVGVFAKATEKDTPRAVVEATGEGLRSETELKADKTVMKTPDSMDSSSIPHPPQPAEDYGKGVIFYLRNNIVVGIVLWNVFNRMPIARKIIKEGKSYEDLSEVAKLFSLHSE